MRTIILWVWLAVHVSAELGVLALPELAKKARPAVVLLTIYDAANKEKSLGTGFFVTPDGKLITNYHVIRGGHHATAKTTGGSVLPVVGVLAADVANDLAVLKVDGKTPSFLPLGSSDNIEAGIRIAVIGSPLGLEATLSEGIVSAVREFSGRRSMLQITSAISPGSSGSPVLNYQGQVIGIATMVLKGGQSLNFAVPSEVARRVLSLTESTPNATPLAEYKDPIDAQIYASIEYKQATEAEAKGDPAFMLVCAENLIVLYPRHHYPHLCAGVAYGLLGRRDHALESLKRALEIKPDCAEAWYNLGVCHDENGHIAGAIEAYQKAVEFQPDFCNAWINLGVALNQVGRHVDELDALEQALKLTPNSALALFNIALTYREMGRVTDAINAAERATKLRPSNGDFWLRLGVNYDEAHRNDKALEAYRRAVTLNPDLYLGWLNLGRSYGLLGDANSSNSATREAVNAFKKATKLKPQDPEAWINLGKSYRHLEQNANAIFAYEQAIKLNPKDAKTWVLVGIAHMKAGDKKASDAAFKKAATLDPTVFNPK